MACGSFAELIVQYALSFHFQRVVAEMFSLENWKETTFCSSPLLHGHGLEFNVAGEYCEAIDELLDPAPFALTFLKIVMTKMLLICAVSNHMTGAGKQENGPAPIAFFCATNLVIEPIEAGKSRPHAANMSQHMNFASM